jgi:SAM-dependent methyltransferase
MSEAMTSEQHNVEMHNKRRLWRQKHLLRAVYAQFYAEMARRVNYSIEGIIVEVGSGSGNLKAYIPRCVSTDIFPSPWLDRRENAYHLSFESGTVSNLLLIDVFHHLQYPGTALREFARVLTPSGRVILLEPAMGLLGRFVFGCFHSEPLGLAAAIQWEAPPGFSYRDCPYYAAQGNASRVFGASAFDAELKMWRTIEQSYYTGIAYLASGGFTGPQLYPAALLRILTWVDSWLSKVPALASRMLIVLEKGS